MSTHYAIRHTTSFLYDPPVSEAVMELRMRPASGGVQRCLQFEVDVQPRARLFAYRDFRGNWVHHFDLPQRHSQLVIVARSHSIHGPWEHDPENPIVRTWSSREKWWSRGHATLFEGP